MSSPALARSALLAFLLAAPAARSQSIRPEVFASIGDGRLFRFEDNPLGSGLNFSAGAGFTHQSGLGLEFEVNRTLGLSAETVPCAVADAACEGSARQGVTGATVYSVNACYEFGRARVRPYVTGGAGALVSKGLAAAIHVFERRALFSEERWSDTGLAVNFGAGIRIRLSRALSLRPEVRLYTASALSRENLSLFRPSVALAWSW